MDTAKKETEASDGRYRQNTVEFWLGEEGIHSAACLALP